jgi:HK97 family phage portal protein
MKWPWSKTETKAQYEDVLSRLIAAQEGTLGVDVTPDNCMASPTVHAIVTAVTRRFAVTPIHVYKTGSSANGQTKEKLPNHPVARLLRSPNRWQTSKDFWSDATSTYLRHGRFYSFKSRGSTGPIRELLPIDPKRVTPTQDDNFNVEFEVSGTPTTTYPLDKFFHARATARDFLKGDSPVADVATAIGLEIMAEKFGATFFKNGAFPLLVFNFQEGSSGFETEEQSKQFISDFKEAFGGDKKNNSMLLPKGIDKPTPLKFEHDKAQFIETRKYQRTVIAGAFGVPPHLVGDLERATFNNVEQQDGDFTLNVIMPIAQCFEAAMERDLLTTKDRNDGIVIRFNLDAVLRADFKSRQEGLKIQREMGALNPNEWREIEGRNPREGGDEYWNDGPSGQSAGNEDDKDEPNDPA